MGDGTDWLRKGFAGALVISAHATLLLWQPVVWRPGAQATHARVTVVLLPPGLVSAANPGPLTTTPLPPRPRATRRQPAAQRLIPPETSTPMTRNADSLPPAAAGQLSGIEPAPQRGAPLDLSYRPALLASAPGCIRRSRHPKTPPWQPASRARSAPIAGTRTRTSGCWRYPGCSSSARTRGAVGERGPGATTVRRGWRDE